MDIGLKFGRLTVLSGHSTIGKRTWQNCSCECGALVSVRRDHLRSGGSKSCGCLQVERTTKHGKHKTKVYITWQQINQRCLNPNNKDYASYGGRGITVTDSWKTFENFYLDMGDPVEGQTLGRQDNDGDYCKENCKWESSTRQARNKRNTVLLTYNGVTMARADWADKFGIANGTLKKRLDAGWSVEKALGQEG